MKLKTLSIIASTFALALVATPFIAKAQTNPNQDQSPTTEAPAKAHGHKGGIWKELGLTDDQKAKMKQIHTDTRTQIEAILTPEQVQKLADIKKAGHQRGEHQKGKHHDGPFASLNLSPEQKAKIKQIRESEKQQIQDLLTPEQKAKIQQFRDSHPRMRRQQQGS